MFSFLKRMYTYNVISSRSHQFTIFPMWQVLIEYFKLSYSLFEKKNYLILNGFWKIIITMIYIHYFNIFIHLMLFIESYSYNYYFLTNSYALFHIILIFSIIILFIKSYF